MKKREKKLRLHCETLHRLSERDLTNAQGGAVAVAYGPQTSCVGGNCCGDTIALDTQ